MKKIHILSFMAILCVGLASSCKKTDPSGLTTVISNSMSANINGTTWSAGAVTGNSNSGILFISGLSSNQLGISMQLPATTAAGTYPVSSTSTTYIIGYTNGTSADVMSAGTLVISSNANNTISGTFTGTLTDPVSMATMPVTNGSFTVKYQ